MERSCLDASVSRRYSLPAGMIALVCLAVLLGGCGKSKPVGAVGGTVQYRGSAVTEGIVTLYSPELGFGHESAIKPDGTFLVEGLPYGPYKISLQPPLIVDDLGGKAFPMASPKDVDNIPAKYRNPSTSGFSCDVAGRRASVELTME